jgi:hypothetical protein
MTIIYRPTSNHEAINQKAAWQYNRKFAIEKLDYGCVNVNLSGATFTMKGIETIAEFIKSTFSDSVKVADVSNITISGGTISDVTNALVIISRSLSNSRLTCLNLANNILGRGRIQDLENLSPSPLLSSCASAMLASVSDMTFLFRSLKDCQNNLTHIALNNNPSLGIAGAITIGNLITECPNLVHVELGGLSPGILGTRELVRGLSHLTARGNGIMLVNLKGCSFDNMKNKVALQTALCSDNVTSLVYVNVENSCLDLFPAAGTLRPPLQRKPKSLLQKHLPYKR